MLALPVALYVGLAAAPAADTVAFRFAWPDALVAEVEYTRSRTRTGRPPTELKLKGRMVTEAKGAELRIGFRDWRNAGTGPAPAAVDPMVEAASRITTVASRAGAFVRVEGIEPALEVVRSMAKGAPADARPTLERLEKMAPALFAKDASETWSALVQFWMGNDLDVGEDYESDSRVPIAALPGETVRLVTRIRVERRLPCPRVGGACVEARLRSTPDARDIERVTKRFVAELGLPAEQLGAVLGEISATSEVLIVTDPARLVPYRLEKTRVMHVAPAPGAPKGAKPMDGRDTSVWTFTPAVVPASSSGRSDP